MLESQVGEKHWPDVWATYWRPLTSMEIESWTDELNQSINNPKNTEVSNALRSLGQGGKYTKYPPKLGAIIQVIRESRREDISDTMGPETSTAFHLCPYCREGGWLSLPMVETERHGWRFARGAWVEKPGVGLWYDLEPGVVTMAVPCGCPKGTPYMLGDTTAQREFARKAWSYLKRLPNSCVAKPVGLNRLFPVGEPEKVDERKGEG